MVETIKSNKKYPPRHKIKIISVLSDGSVCLNGLNEEGKVVLMGWFKKKDIYDAIEKEEKRVPRK